MHHRLPNYVRSARRNAGLSAKDLATLLGRKTAACVSKYESYGRNPTIKSAIMLEIALTTPLSELFPGAYHDAKAKITRHAEALLQRLTVRPDSAILRARKRRLRMLIERNLTSKTV